MAEVATVATAHLVKVTKQESDKANIQYVTTYISGIYVLKFKY